MNPQPVIVTRAQIVAAFVPLGELGAFLLRKARVSRAVAMEALGHSCHRSFNKVVDACPEIRHRLPGEGRDRYRTDVIASLLLQGTAREYARPTTARTGTRCAVKGRKAPAAKIISPRPI